MAGNILFFDFDNTLYSHQTNCVPESAKAALCRLQEAGHILVLATGRGQESLLMMERELGFLPETVILLNGQVIQQRGITVFERYIALPSMNSIIQTAKSRGLSYGGYCSTGLLVNAYCERVKAVWREFGSPLPALHENFEEELALYHGHLYITEAEAALFAPALEDYVTNWSHRYLVNLIPKAAGKSQAVRWCLSTMHAGESYAFGDGYNDVDMIQAVDHGIAMGDGFAALKEQAEYVTRTADEGGIALALAHYGFQ